MIASSCQLDFEDEPVTNCPPAGDQNEWRIHLLARNPSKTDEST